MTDKRIYWTVTGTTPAGVTHTVRIWGRPYSRNVKRLASYEMANVLGAEFTMTAVHE